MKADRSNARARTVRRPRVTSRADRGGVADGGVLVVVDATPASRRVLEYVGRILAGCRRVDCHLAYIAPNLPAGLLESGGSELPEREMRIEADLRREQRRWTAAADRKAERILAAARGTLQEMGVAAARIHTCVSSPLDARRIVDEVLLLARDETCRTVAVGHRAHSWFAGLGSGHLAEQLVRSAKGLAVWVVD
ncbi:MAG: universal stress protein [Acidobacteria bacterium]|nr:universal stress protein [Acidobacteriota bacterium]